MSPFNPQDMSDHRYMYDDLDTKLLISITPVDCIPGRKQKITKKNIRSCEKFKKGIKRHKNEERVSCHQ